MIRLCLRFGVEPVFIPEREPQFNGSEENFNGWFQLLLLERLFKQPGDLRQELARLQEAVNTQQVRPQLDWAARRRRNTAGACGCRNCRRASRCRRSGSPSQRGA